MRLTYLQSLKFVRRPISYNSAFAGYTVYLATLTFYLFTVQVLAVCYFMVATLWIWIPQLWTWVHDVTIHSSVMLYFVLMLHEAWWPLHSITSSRWHICVQNLNFLRSFRLYINTIGVPRLCSSTLWLWLLFVIKINSFINIPKQIWINIVICCASWNYDASNSMS